MSMSYVPTMIANKKAIEEGSDNWEIDLDEGKWKQKSFLIKQNVWHGSKKSMRN